MPGIILPRKTVHELHRLIEASEATVKVGVSASKARFEIGTITLTTKLIDGTFPDYARVIPKGNDKALKVSQRGVHRAPSTASPPSPASAAAQSSSTSTATSWCCPSTTPRAAARPRRSASTTTRRRSEIGFNARYLLDIAGQLESDTAHFQLADPGSPDHGQGRQRRRRALRPDADARLTRALAVASALCRLPLPGCRSGRPAVARAGSPAHVGRAPAAHRTSATMRASRSRRARPDRAHRPQRLRQDQPARSRIAADGGPGPAPRRPIRSWHASGVPTWAVAAHGAHAAAAPSNIGTGLKAGTPARGRGGSCASTARSRSGSGALADRDRHVLADAGHGRAVHGPRLRAPALPRPADPLLRSGLSHAARPVRAGDAAAKPPAGRGRARACALHRAGAHHGRDGRRHRRRARRRRRRARGRHRRAARGGDGERLPLGGAGDRRHARGRTWRRDPPSMWRTPTSAARGARASATGRPGARSKGRTAPTCSSATAPRRCRPACAPPASRRRC